ncbi:MAG: hypothetical protein KH009_04415 [Clostridiales bacterium]|nr:hypothetical protein [Clostridiales bacterium]
MTVTEKVSYLKGLAEGLGIDETQKEGKIIKAIIDVLDDVAFTVADLEDGFDELVDQVDMIDEDLDSLVEDLYDEDEEEDEDWDDEDEDFDFDDEDGELYEVTCPSCGDTICITEAMLDEGSINCPGCGELLEFDFDDCGCDDEECGCGCGHDHEHSHEE